MTINEQLLTDLVADTNALRADILENSAPAFNTLASHGADLATLGPIASDLEANATHIAAIQSAPADAARATTARQEAETAAAEAVSNSGVNPIMANAIRNSYSIAGRAPSVVADPVNGVYFSANGACDFDSLITHNRNSTASFVGSNGHIQSVSTDTPRTENHFFKDGIWQRAGLRVDGQATNYIETSDMTAFLKTNAIVTAGAADGPGGPNSMFKIEPTSGLVNGDGVRIYRGSTPKNAGTRYVRSCYFRTGSGIKTVWLHTDGVPLNGFDLETLSPIDVPTGEHAGVIDCGDDVYRFWGTFTATNTVGTSNNFIYLSNRDYYNVNVPPGFDGGAHVYAWGYQVEEGSLPTSFIASSGTAVTRQADTFAISSENLPSSQGGLTFVLEGAIDHIDLDIGERVRWFNWIKSNPAGYVNAFIFDNQLNVSMVQARYYDENLVASNSDKDPLGTGLSRQFKIALCYSAREVQNVVNGTPSTPTQNPNGMPDLEGTDLIQFLMGFNGTLSRFRIFDTALPEAALIAETML